MNSAPGSCPSPHGLQMVLELFFNASPFKKLPAKLDITFFSNENHSDDQTGNPDIYLPAKKTKNTKKLNERLVPSSSVLQSVSSL